MSDDIQVCCASLDQPAPQQQLAQTLSTHEQTRSERFYFEQDRKRFVVCCELLRTILGGYLDMEPSQHNWRPLFAEYGCVNIVAGNKNPMQQWLSMSEAIAHCRAGASVWS